MSASSQTATAAFYLAAADLAAWLDKRAETRRVLAPVQEGSAVVFRRLQAGRTPLLERARIAPKAAVMPTGDTLFSFAAEKDSADPGTLHVSLDDKAGKNIEDTLIFACRSCDARGFLALDKAYLNGPYKDPYYAARRENTTILSLTCAEPCPTCFCHWVGGGPDSAEGSDATLTPVSGGYVFEAYSQKGVKLLDGLTAAAAAATTEAEAVKAKARAAQKPAPDLADAPARIAERFADTDFWQAETAKCLACGACTYMCPTCQCFTITDEGDMTRGERLRSWDSCMSSRFTLEASGHNPRSLKAMRMRQRVSHKYSYVPKNSNIFSCSGCGRCVRYCPAALDIREIVVKAMAK